MAVAAVFSLPLSPSLRAMSDPGSHPSTSQGLPHHSSRASPEFERQLGRDFSLLGRDMRESYGQEEEMYYEGQAYGGGLPVSVEMGGGEDEEGDAAASKRTAADSDDDSEAEEQVGCSVCHEDITEQVQQVHYGAKACFSCRAFFRRAQSAKRRPFKVCKKEGRCPVTSKTRRYCASCRYALCLDSGMNPDLVLSEEQKMQRFRKMLKKKKRKKKEQDAERAQTPPAAEQMPPPIKEDSLSESPMQPQSAAPALTPPYLMSKDLFLPPSFHPFSDRTVPGAALAANRSPLERKILSLHSPTRPGQGEPAPLTCAELYEIQSSLSSRFRSFAFSQPDFLALSHGDRQCLLEQNVSTYGVLVLCQYLMADTPEDQVSHLVRNPAMAELAVVTALLKTADVEALTLAPLFGRDCELARAFAPSVASALEQWGPWRGQVEPDLLPQLILFSERDHMACRNQKHVRSVRARLARHRSHRLVSKFCQDLAQLAHMARALHLFLRLDGLDPPHPTAILLPSNMVLLVTNRSQQVAHFLAVQHAEYVDDLPGLMADRVPDLVTLYLLRLHLAESYEDQLRILGISMDPNLRHLFEKQEKVKILHLKTKIPFLLKSLTLLKSFLSEFSSCLESHDICFLLTLVLFFSPRAGGGGGVKSGEMELLSLSRYRSAYLGVLAAVCERGGRGGWFHGLLSQCLAAFERVSQIVPNFYCDEAV